VPLLAAAVFSLLAAARTGLAQTTQTGMLLGRVALENGRIIANANVIVRQEDGSFERTMRTDALGEFRFNFMVPGTYTVTVRQLGFTEVTVPSGCCSCTTVRCSTTSASPLRRKSG
jgi:hypothetical protein